MPLHVLCPKCGKRYAVADEQAGGTGTCPACGTVARIPALDSPLGGLPQQGGPPAYAPYMAPQSPAEPYGAGYADPGYFYELAVANFEAHRKLIGIFGILVGVLSMLWACACGLVVYVALAGGMPNPPPEPGIEAMAAVYGVLGVLSIGTGIVQVLAGISLLRQTRACRSLGIASGIISCMSMWGCFVWLFNVGYGVYALVIFCGRNATIALEVRPSLAKPRAAPN